MTDEQLAHYGVKGMHWGVRKDRRRRQSSDYKSTATLRKRPPQSLSNMQLKKVNERAQLEAKFSQMNPSKVAKGKHAVNGILKVATGAAGAAAVRELATNPKYREAASRGAKLVKKRFARPETLLGQVARDAYGFQT